MMLVAFVALVLSACSDSAESETVSDDEGSEEKIQLDFWYAYGGNIEEANQELVDRFNASQDDIEVTASFQGSYFDVNSKVQASIAAGNPPEVFVGQDTMTETFANEGMIEDLTPLAEADAEEIRMDDFIPGLLGNAYVGDAFYGMPYFKSTPLLYVNKTMLDEAGIELEQLETWDGFQEAAREITNEEQHAITMEIDIWIYESLIAQAGGSMFNEEGTAVAFHEEPGVEAMDFSQDLIKEGVWEVPIGDNAADIVFQDFATQQSAFRFSSTANLTAMLDAAEENGFELAALMLPEYKERAVTTGGSNLVMMAGLDEETKQAAWEFMKFMGDTEQNIIASEITGYLPTRFSTIESEERQALHEEQPLYQVAIDQLEYAEARPMVPGYNEINTVWVEEYERLISDPELDTAEALANAAERANQIIQK